MAKKPKENSRVACNCPKCNGAKVLQDIWLRHNGHVSSAIANPGEEIFYMEKRFISEGQFHGQLKHLVDALEAIVHVHSMHCEHYINVSRHSYDLAQMASDALRQFDKLWPESLKKLDLEDE